MDNESFKIACVIAGSVEMALGVGFLFMIYKEFFPSTKTTPVIAADPPKRKPLKKNSINRKKTPICGLSFRRHLLRAKMRTSHIQGKSSYKVREGLMNREKSKRTCARCGKKFTPRISAQICCSKECGNERRKELKRKCRPEGGRLCHDCKQPVPGNNYRCADCWRKWRIKYHISDDAFHNSSSLLAHCDGF